MIKIKLIKFLLIVLLAFIPARNTAQQNESLPENITGGFSFSKFQDNEVYGAYSYGNIDLKGLSKDQLTKFRLDIDAIRKVNETYTPLILFELEGEPPIFIPEELSSGLDIIRVPVPSVFKKQFWNNVYVPPTNGDIAAGVLFSVMRGSVTGIVWFSNADPIFATVMTIWSTFVTYTFNKYHLTLDNILIYGLKDRNSKIGKLYNNFISTMRSFAIDTIMANATNAVGGFPKTVLHTTIDNIATTVISNIHTTKRNETLKNYKKLKLTYNILTRPFFYTLRAFQDLNLWPVVFTMWAYPVTAPVIITFASYSTLLIINTYAKDKVISALDLFNKKTYNIVKSLGIELNSKSKDQCSKWLHGKKEDI